MQKSVFQMLLDVKTRGANNIRKLGNSLQGAQGQAKNLALSFKSMVGPLAAIAGIAGGAAIARGIFGSTAQLQSQAKSLEVLTGSAETTAEILKDIRAFGAATPFQVKDLIDVTKKLKAFGIETDDLVETTRRLGDVAGATGADLDGIATAFGQIRAKGKFAQEENLQLLERGVDLTTELKKMYGLSGEELAKAMTKGQISFEAANVALRRLTNEGGEYFGGAVSQSETLNGKLSTMLDAFNNLAINVGTVLEPSFKAFLDTAIRVVTIINSMFTEENIKRAQRFIGTLLNNLPNVFNITKALLKVTAAYAGVLVGITAGKFFTVLLGNMALLRKVTRELHNLEKLKLGVLKAQAVIQAALSGATKGGKPLLGLLIAGGTGVAAFAGLNALVDNIVDTIQNKFNDAAGSVDLTALLGGDLTVPPLKLLDGGGGADGKGGSGKEDDPEAPVQVSDKVLSLTKQLNAAKLEGNALKVVDLGYDLALQQLKEKELTGNNLALEQNQLLTNYTLERLDVVIAMGEAYDDINNKLTKSQELFENIKTTVQVGLTNAIMGLIDGTKSLGESLSGILNQLGNMFLQAGIGNFADSKGEGGSGLLGLFKFANGGVFAKNKIVPFAYGGVVNKPTLFPMANGMGLMGEAGAEAVLPLRRGRGGRLGVEASGGGVGDIVVNVDASSASAQGDTEQGRQLGKVIGIAVRSEILKQQRPGGLLA